MKPGQSIATTRWRSLLIAASIGHSAAGISDEVYVLDSEAPSITAIAANAVTSEFEITKRVALTGQPDRMILSPDGSRLLVMEKGREREFGRSGLIPQERSSLTVVDTRSMEVLSHHDDLCWSADLGGIERGVGVGGSWYFTTSGDRFILLCKGNWFERTSSGGFRRLSQPRAQELVVFDLTDGSIYDRVPIESPLTSWLSSPTHDRIVLSFPYQTRAGRREERPAELWFMDGENLEVRETVLLPGEPFDLTMLSSGDLLYVLDPGEPTKRARSNVDGTLHVVSLTDQNLLRSIELGTGPRARQDTRNDQLIVSSLRGPSQPRSLRDLGIVRTIQDGELQGIFEVGRNPIYVLNFPERQRLYTVGEDTLTITETDSGVSREIEYNARRQYFGELLFTADHSLAFLLAANNPDFGFSLEVLDLERYEARESLVLGRSGVILGKFLVRAALAEGLSDVVTSAMPGAASLADIGGVVARNVAIGSIIEHLVLMVTRGGVYANAVFGPNKGYVYAINEVSRDVTLIDAVEGTIVRVIDDTAGARRLKLLPGSMVLAVLANGEELILIDPSTQAVIEKRSFGGNFILLGEDRGAIALSASNGAVYLLDGLSLSVVGQATGFEQPHQFSIYPPLF